MFKENRLIFEEAVDRPKATAEIGTKTPEGINPQEVDAEFQSIKAGRIAERAPQEIKKILDNTEISTPDKVTKLRKLQTFLREYAEKRMDVEYTGSKDKKREAINKLSGIAQQALKIDEDIAKLEKPSNPVKEVASIPTSRPTAAPAPKPETAPVISKVSRPAPEPTPAVAKAVEGINPQEVDAEFQSIKAGRIAERAPQEIKKILDNTEISTPDKVTKLRKLQTFLREYAEKRMDVEYTGSKDKKREIKSVLLRIAELGIKIDIDVASLVKEPVKIVKPEPRLEPMPAPAPSPKPIPSIAVAPRVEPKPTPAPTPKPAPAPIVAKKPDPAPAPKQEPKSTAETIAENELNEFVRRNLDTFYSQNRNSPFDTSISNSDGSTRGAFRSKGETMVMDNVTGEHYTVSRDPKKASTALDRITDKPKILTGEPKLCIDMVLDCMKQSFNLEVPKDCRSTAKFEDYAAANPKNYKTFRINKNFPGFDNSPDLGIKCKVGDILTTMKTKGDYGRHSMIITKVDSNGTPTEILNSASITNGVGLRPFFSPKIIVEDFRGWRRYAGVFSPNIKVVSVIRPNYTKPYIAHLEKQKSREKNT